MAAVVVALAMLEVEAVVECPMRQSPSRQQRNTASPLVPAVPEEPTEEMVQLVANPASNKVRRQSATRTAAREEPEVSRQAVVATV